MMSRFSSWRIYLSTLDPSPKRRLHWRLKVALFALFVALHMGGCMRDRLVDYYDNGQKKWERHWKGQELDGPVTWWYENGQKKLEMNYKDGKFDGPLTGWDENGTEKRRDTYKDGELVKNYPPEHPNA